MYKVDVRSFRDLPIRFADFGALHRNEESGALTGLTRVRKFQQDDAHIFCREDQISSEIIGCLDFLKTVYGTFGFKFSLELATRPEKFMGEIDTWNKAENTLAIELDNFCGKGNWKIKEKDGAFYGPKIDIYISDVINRRHQCATIQLDFQLSERFGLEYRDSGSNENTVILKRPVIIHRAIYGSIERFLALLIEHTGGKWPFWLSPRQIIILTISDEENSYAKNIQDILKKENFIVDMDDSIKSLPKKIRDAQLSQYNYILIIGKKEMKEECVSVRTRDNIDHGTKKIEDLIKELKYLVEKYQ